MPSTRRRSYHQLWSLCVQRLPALLSTSCRGQVPSMPQVHNRTWRSLNALTNFAESPGKNISPTSDSATCNAPSSLTCLQIESTAASTSSRGSGRASPAVRTHPPDLLSPRSERSAKLAPHTQLIRRLPVKPWPEQINRGRCVLYQQCQAVMSLWDSPP